MHANEPALLARGPDTTRGTASEAAPGTKVVALGYQSVRAPARMTEPQVQGQADAIGDYCSRKGWDLITVLRDVDARHGGGLPNPR